MKLQLEEITTQKNIRGVQSKIISQTDSITMKNLILGSNESIPSHQVPVEVTFYVLEGSGTITISNTSYKVLKNSIVLCPPNSPMTIQADALGLSFLNIKTPGYIVTK
jgi:quercetin dioxygenase-like cupin family protein